MGRSIPAVPPGWTPGRATPPSSRHLGPTSWHGVHGGLQLVVDGHLDRDLVYAWLNARRDELGDRLVRMSAVLS
ncbi:MAG TPA: hypothetical protein VGP53_06150, partial [Acidimicrobiales bacterium]|nr:hypothetical protein [Acidimicrobiales bacterium]